MRPLCNIAYDIRTALFAEYSDAPKPPAFMHHALPYIDALRHVRTTADTYYFDSGTSLVAYALSNLGPWRGEAAKALKAELRAHLRK